MENEQVTVIDSRLGKREVQRDKIINFPRGIIGYEHLHKFALLQIRPEAALLVLQSIEDSTLGLVVTDPFAFVPDYSLYIGDADKELLQVTAAEDITVLVTASIPPGKPVETALHLLGPIFINHFTRIGVQVPQPEDSHPAKFYIHQLQK